MAHNSCSPNGNGGMQQVFEYNTPAPLRLQARGLSDLYRKSFPVGYYHISFAAQVLGLRDNDKRIVFPKLRVMTYLGSLPTLWFDDMISPSWEIYTLEFASTCNAVMLQGALPYDNGDPNTQQSSGVSFSLAGFIEK